MNARDRELLWIACSRSVATATWREYANLSRLGLVDLDRDGQAIAGEALAKMFGSGASYRSIKVTDRGREVAAQEARARAAALIAQREDHQTANATRGTRKTCLCGACCVLDMIAREHAAMGWP